MNPALDWRGPEWKSGLLAFVVHLLFFLLLVFGLSWHVEDNSAPIQAQIWNSLPAARPVRHPEPKAVLPTPRPPEPAPKLQPKPQPIPKPQPAPEPQPEPKLKPVPETHPAVPTLKQPDIGLDKKRREALRQRLLQDQREQARLMAQQAAQEKLALQKQRRERQLKELQALQQQQNSMVDSSLNRDLHTLREQQAAALAAGRLNALVGKYKEIIAQKVRGFVRIPPDIKGNPQAVFRVSVLPTGDVTAVVLQRSSGNPVYDQAVRWAIQAASPLPLPDDPRVANQFQPTMEFSFCPKEQLACPSP